jgi:hypothetical protein
VIRGSGNSPEGPVLGVGSERLDMALMEIESSRPYNNLRLRFQSASGMDRPDRAEYFWAKPLPLGGRGPMIPERSVDYQELRITMENGGEKFSMVTEIPIVAVDPVLNPNTTGLGDLNVGPKTVLIDGRKWRITQIFRTFIPTGSSLKGLGTKHTAMEPGLLTRYKWTDETYLHAELKYRFTIAADPFHAGEVFKYGIGVSHLWYDSDGFSLIPTLEFVGWSIVDGQVSTPVTGVPLHNLDPETIFNIHPGLRIVSDNDSELGLFELGVGAGFAATKTRWYDTQFRVEARWSF